MAPLASRAAPVPPAAGVVAAPTALLRRIARLSIHGASSHTLWLLNVFFWDSWPRFFADSFSVVHNQISTTFPPSPVNIIIITIITITPIKLIIGSFSLNNYERDFLRFFKINLDFCCDFGLNFFWRFSKTLSRFLLDNSFGIFTAVNKKKVFVTNSWLIDIFVSWIFFGILSDFSSILRSINMVVWKLVLPTSINFFWLNNSTVN